MATLNFATLFIFLVLLVSSSTNATPILKQSRQPQPCVKASFSNVTLSQGVSIIIERVESVAQGGAFTEGANNIAWPDPATNLPPLCAAIINVTDTSVTPQSNYRFGMFLPNTWNSRILTIGSESFAGGINWPGMAEGSHYNMTTISTDNGHNSTPGDLTWAFKNDARLQDWGYRAVHGSVQIAKILTKNYYNIDIGHSYYSGCSTGGRQGLKEIQISPESFDGALIGAPAWDTKYLMPHLTKIGLDALNDGANITDITQLFTLLTYVYGACDGIDGVKDTVISMPEKCDINAVLKQSQCSNGLQPPYCLTDGQINLARSIYNDYVTTNGTFIQNGFLPGSEIGWLTWVHPFDATGFDSDYERYFLYDDINWATTQYSDDVAFKSINNNPGQATADHYDISEFKDRGGKILMYHGMADGTVPTKSSLYYYSQTQKAMAGTNLDEFFRYFQIPGMSHCWNAYKENVNAPWMIGSYGQASQIKFSWPDGWSVPKHQNDPNYDALAALIQWTEGGSAVEQIIATNWSPNDNVTEFRTRPICKWPNYASLTGSDVNNAASWKCVQPK